MNLEAASRSCIPPSQLAQNTTSKIGPVFSAAREASARAGIATPARRGCIAGVRLKAAVASRNIVQDGDYAVGKEPEELRKKAVSDECEREKRNV